MATKKSLLNLLNKRALSSCPQSMFFYPLGNTPVPFTHKQVLAAVLGKGSVRKLPKDKPFFNWIGLDHVAGLIEIHLQALWLGYDISRGFSIASLGNCVNLVGRAKEVININGVKIIASNLQVAIEDALNDRVSRLVVFPSMVSNTEQVTVAYIPKNFPTRGEDVLEITRLETQAYLLRTATRPLVFSLQEKSIPLLPVSTLSKISRLKIMRLYEDGEFASDLKLHQQQLLRATNAEREAVQDMSILETKAEFNLLQRVAGTIGLSGEALDITPTTSLFDIRFTSMHVLKFKYNIKKSLGIDVPVILIIKNSTICALAAVLDSHLQNPIRSPVHLVPTDNYDPVVLFHPGVGEVLGFIGLAQSLAADDRPVYALRAAGFKPH
ncbi:hypothetical protein DM02DRAFT_647592 [Periconia macrospinosa]|uniref:Carrier domain-containing protein n=1 Tax=Periconia macrospinosa TaxID=97972 RepID=A0A2V1CXD9_9PLEO|nr:hypothetical protein DM02DRAFT_647592 [Periconia macrospinosa]